MGVSDDFATPQERAEHFRKLLASRNTELTPNAESQFDSDLVPDIERFELSEEAQRLEDFVQGIDILEAYRKFINKMDPQPRGNSREVHISCPIPGHVDNNPSAWANVDTKTWYCGGCGIGGDIYDLAAIGLGYSWPDSYKTKDEFPRLKKDLAESFGLVVHYDSLTRTTTVYEPGEVEEEVELEPEIQSEQATKLSLVPAYSEVQQIQTDFSDTDLFIDWESIVPQDTFLYHWLKALGIDHFPHEYHFWSGLLCVGLAAGHNIVLLDRKNVKGNLYVCILGESGTGKTQAIEPVQDLIREVLPFKEDQYFDPEGIKILSSPNSGERLIDLFKYEVLDPSTQRVDHVANVTGILQENEFSELMSRAGRMGSSLKEVLINMYDASSTRSVSTTSRGSGDNIAHGPFLSLITTTQPDAVGTFLRQSDVNSGTLNRFIFVNGKSRLDPVGWQPREPDISDPIDAYNDLYSNWIFKNKSLQIPVLGTTAEKVWLDFFDKNLRLVKKGEIRQDAIFARVDLILKKLILLFCINEKKTVPDADLMERVLSLYSYLRLTYSQFSDNLARTETSVLEERIEEICRTATDKPPSASDIKRIIGKKYSTEEVIRAVNNLVIIGKLDGKLSKPKRGPATKRYHYIA